MRITPLVLTGALATAALAAPADAAPRKPITKTYEATAPTPDFTNLEPNATYTVCNQTVPQSWHLHVFTAPAPGKLKVTLSGYVGDWDLLLTDSKGTQLAAGDLLEPGTPTTPAEESATLKIKKAKTKINIIACNFAGGPTATVKYTFTYA